MAEKMRATNDVGQTQRFYTMAKHGRDFWWLLVSQLFALREEWFWYLVQLAFAPLTFLIFLWLLLGQFQPESMVFVVTGSLVYNVSMGGMLTLGQHIGALKDYNAYEHYAALPLSKWVFILALATRGIVLTLPSALLIVVIGVIFFHFTPTGMTFVILLLGGYALSGLGAFIGFWSPTARVASMMTQVLQTLLVLLAPVYIAFDRLPAVLQWTSYVTPTSYMATALRSSMLGKPVKEYLLEILLLFCFTVVSLGLIPIKLRWRSK